SVDIVNVAALSIADENRVWIISAIIAGYAQRQPLDCSLVRIPRARGSLLVGFDLFLKALVHHFLHPCFLRWPLTALRFTPSSNPIPPDKKSSPSASRCENGNHASSTRRKMAWAALHFRAHALPSLESLRARALPPQSPPEIPYRARQRRAAAASNSP